MNSTAQKLLILSTLLIVFMGGFLAWSWKDLPPQIPWFYSLPSGEQQLVDKSILIWSVVGAIVLLIATSVVAIWSSRKDAIVETTIMMGSLTAVLLLMATFFRVMQIFVGI